MPPPVQDTYAPYLDRLRADHGPFALFDAHTHVGQNDPDGFRQTPDELLEALATCDARGLVFPMHEPGGYADGVANDEAIATAARSDGRVLAFCRVDPNEGDAALDEARRALDAGARGIKLHPRAEQFTLSHPTVEGLITMAHERGLPVLIHAGRGIPALGADTVRLSGAFPGAHLILAHCGISDLAWIWQELPNHPNLYVDTSWWSPTDMIALLTYAPPGQVLYASDSPYGHPLPSAVNTLRCAAQAGLTPEQIQGVAGGQLARITAGEAPADLGPAPRSITPLDPLLERIGIHLSNALIIAFRGGEYEESLALARLACDIRGDGQTARVAQAARELLDLFDRYLAEPLPGNPFPQAARFLLTALYVARTPDVPLP